MKFYHSIASVVCARAMPIKKIDSINNMPRAIDVYQATITPHRAEDLHAPARMPGAY